MHSNVRNSLKMSPFADKEKLREGLLKKAVEKMRSGRWENIAKLRGGVLDRAELAKSILHDAIGATKLSHEAQLLLSTQEADRISDMEVCRNLKSQEISDGQNEATSSFAMASDSPRNYLVCEDDDLLAYLGSEEHQLLMDEIAEAIKTELEEEYACFDCGEIDEMVDVDNLEWSNYEAESSQDAMIICPICRLAYMQISSETGQCSCGASVTFQDCGSFHGAATAAASSSSATMIANRLKERLAEIIDMHAAYCPSVYTTDNTNPREASSSILGAGDLIFYQIDRNGSLLSHCSYCNFNQQVT